LDEGIKDIKAWKLSELNQSVLALNKQIIKKYEEDYFYAIREWDRNENYQDKTPVQRASRFIYLNKSCFNGLYRVNSKGQFNVPFGKYGNPLILDENSLLALNQYLNTNQVVILNLDFQEAVKDAKKGDSIRARNSRNISTD